MNDKLQHCPFCRRIAEHDYDPMEWRAAVSFEPLNPVTPGHRLVVSKKHIESAAADPDLAGEVMGCAAALAREVGSCNIITSIGSDATQTVFHLHVHVVPRRPGDGLILPWTFQQQ